MIGWVLYLLLKLSHAEWALRLPVTLLPFALAAGIYFVLRRTDETKAALAAFAFLLLPANVWGVFITTDTPLIFFCFVSALCYRAGLARRSLGWYALAGAFLGLAFLSKYFAVLLGLAYVAYVAFSPREERDWRALALVVLCSLPFAAVNLWWNYEHCWANLMFNLYNRHANAGWSWKTPLIYAATVLYVLSPVALWQLAKERRAVTLALVQAETRFFAVAFAFPFVFFADFSTARPAAHKLPICAALGLWLYDSVLRPPSTGLVVWPYLIPFSPTCNRPGECSPPRRSDRLSDGT